MAQKAVDRKATPPAPRSRMLADADDPWVGVHVLTEHIFCPRAGLILFEQKVEDDGDEESGQAMTFPSSAFRFAPIYYPPEIERALQAQMNQLWWVFALPGMVLAVTVIGVIDAVVKNSSFVGWLWFLGIGLLLSLILIVRQVKRINYLQRMRRMALTAKPHEPGEGFKNDKPVNWWRLLKAGFDTVNYKEALRDERWRVAGKPWRVLRRGDTRIPVFKKRFCDGPNGKKLYRQHYARIAAYCHLLEKAEGVKSPYGVILFGDSFDGIAVANAPGARKAFHEGLVGARTVFREASKKKKGKVPPAPKMTTLCRGCQHGKPFVHRPGETEHYRFDKQLGVNKKTGEDGLSYHSACGDRFGWVPPHDKAFDKGLR